MSQESFMGWCGVVGESVLRVMVWDGERKSLNQVHFKVEVGLTDIHMRLRIKPEGGKNNVTPLVDSENTLLYILEELVWCLLFLDVLQNFKLVQNIQTPQDKLLNDFKL